MQPYFKCYQELRTLAQRLQRWDTLRPEMLAWLVAAGNTVLLIEILLDEGAIDDALLLEGMKPWLAGCL